MTSSRPVARARIPRCWFLTFDGSAMLLCFHSLIVPQAFDVMLSTPSGTDPLAVQRAA